MSTPTGGRDDDIEARFRSIIDTEFGTDRATTPGAGRPTPPATGRPATRPATAPVPGEPFNLERAMAEAEPDAPTEPFEPPVTEPVRWPTGRVGVGAALVALALVAWLAMLLGAALPSWAGMAAVAAFAVGLAVLLASVPRTGRDPWDDGTRV